MQCILSRAATRILLKCPQIINVKKSDGFAALHLSAFNGHYDVCEVLVEAVSIFGFHTFLSSAKIVSF